MDINPASCFESGKYGVQLFTATRANLLSFVAFLTPDTHSQWPTVPQNKPRNLLLTTAFHSESHKIFQGLPIKSANRRSLNIPSSKSNLVSNELMFNFCAEAGTIPVLIIINIRCYKLPTFGQCGFKQGVLLKWWDTFRTVSCFVFRHSISLPTVNNWFERLHPSNTVKRQRSIPSNKIRPTIFYRRFEGS